MTPGCGNQDPMSQTLLDELDELNTTLDACMARDRPRFRRRLKTLRRAVRKQGKLQDAGSYTRLRREVDASRQLLCRRRHNHPQVEFSGDLPVIQRRQEIADLISAHQVCVIAGATGSGKSTQLPRICLALGRGVDAMIGHTQPRRIAARRVAARVAAELGPGSRERVGCKVRFSDTVTQDTCIKLMTDGILLGELHDDRLFRQYDTLILDEAHERSLNIDFLLGYLKRVLARRRDFKLVITSATANTEELSGFFDDAPVLELDTRRYPVDVSYLEPGDQDTDEGAEDLTEAVTTAVDRVAGGSLGDILVFLPGEREIKDVQAALAARDTFQVLPLYGRLDNREQDHVFAQGKRQKVVLATNVAETSLTVPGIGYVIDTGLARISRYSHRSKIQRLPIERISRASAEQRAGRCGRTGPGQCLRLYTELDYQRMQRHTPPEIKRTNLASVILRMKALELGDIEHFCFVTEPHSHHIRDGQRLLTELGALDGDGGLTDTGRKLSRLPLDPRLGRMIVTAALEGCVSEILVLAAALSIQDPFGVSVEHRAAATAARRRFSVKHSDLLSYLKFWRRAEKARKRGISALRKLCRQTFVSWQRLLEWQDVHQQLAERAADLKLPFNSAPAEPEHIYRAMLSGSLTLVGRKTADGGYQGARGNRFLLSPASSLRGKDVAWVMAAELIETRRVYAHRATRIRPAWVEQVAPPELLKKSYAAPCFDACRGVVYASETVQLFGLPVVSGRQRAYDAVAPADARRVFIANALVAGQVHTSGDFLTHNQQLINKLEKLAERARRTDLFADELRMLEFYDQRLPSQITRTSKFERWRVQVEQEQPEYLFMRESDVRDMSVPTPDRAAFPAELPVEGYRFPVRYRFLSGADDDGATVSVPVALINQLPVERFEWGIPGWLHAKVEALLRALPKHLRRRIVPLPQALAHCMDELEVGHGSLTEQLGKILARHYHVDVPDLAWPLERLDAYLRLNIELLDLEFKPCAMDRDLARLKARFGLDASAGFEQIRTREYDRDDLRSWDFELADRIEFRCGPVRLAGFPSLVDCGDSVSIRVLETRTKARAATKAGVERLMRLHLQPTLKQLARQLPDIEQAKLLYVAVPPARVGNAVTGHDMGLVDDILEVGVRVCFIDALSKDIGTASEFETWLVAGEACIADTVVDISRLVGSILQRLHRLREQIEMVSDRVPVECVQDIEEHMASLVFRGFVLATGWKRLQDYPRYLDALEARVRKLGTAANKDLKRLRRVLPVTRQLLAALDQGAGDSREADLRALRWEIEELRVAVFAQEIGARSTMSVAALESRLHDLTLLPNTADAG